MTTQELFLSLCVQKAWEFQGITLPNPAVGALILDENYNILSIQAHKKAGFPHAEVAALLEVFETLTNQQTNLTDSASIHRFLLEHHNGLFYDKTLYVSLEPCNHYGKTPPCALLLSALKPKQIFIGTKDEWGISSNGAKTLMASDIPTFFIECRATKNVLLPFLSLYEMGHFNLFKLAMRLNGDYTSGQISSKESQIFTHNQRTTASSIIISGKTLRTDKPTLDSRFATLPKHNPNVQILTSNKNLPQAPLFTIPNREVYIAHSPQDLRLDSGYNIIEGGFKMLATLQNHIDMLLLHIAPNITSTTHNNSPAIVQLKEMIDFEVLHTAQYGKDMLLWLKPHF